MKYVIPWLPGDEDGPDTPKESGTPNMDKSWFVYDSYAELSGDVLPPKNVHLDDHTVGTLIALALKGDIAWKSLSIWHADFDKDGLIIKSRPNKGNPYIMKTSDGTLTIGEVKNFYVLKGTHFSEHKPFIGDGPKKAKDMVLQPTHQHEFEAKARHTLERVDYWRVSNAILPYLTPPQRNEYHRFHTWTPDQPNPWPKRIIVDGVAVAASAVASMVGSSNAPVDENKRVTTVADEESPPPPKAGAQPSQDLTAIASDAVIQFGDPLEQYKAALDKEFGIHNSKQAMNRPAADNTPPGTKRKFQLDPDGEGSPSVAGHSAAVTTKRMASGEKAVVHTKGDTDLTEIEAFRATRRMAQRGRDLPLAEHTSTAIPLNYKQRALLKAGFKHCTEGENLLLLIIKNVEQFMPASFKYMYSYAALTRQRDFYDDSPMGTPDVVEVEEMRNVDETGGSMVKDKAKGDADGVVSSEEYAARPDRPGPSEPKIKLFGLESLTSSGLR